MNAIQRAFYLAVLWATRFELAVAKNAPVRNHGNIAALQNDIAEYERALLRLEFEL